MEDGKGLDVSNVVLETENALAVIFFAVLQEARCGFLSRTF